MNIKRFICVILAFLLLATIACKKNAPNSTVNENSEENNTQIGDLIIDNNQTVNIVERGSSEFNIVEPEEPTAIEHYAAMELQSFLYQSTGATLNIVKDISYQGSKCFSIGETTIKKTNPKVKTLDLKEDGFVITGIGSSVCICGMNGRGTLYGVYDFLEKYIGIRFLTDVATYIPKVSTLPLREINIKEEPAIATRLFFAESESGDSVKYSAFAARCRYMRFNGSSEIYGGDSKWCNEIDTTHNAFKTYVSWDKYYATHPEWFCYPQTWDICYTNGVTEDGKLDETMQESALKTAIASLKEYVRKSDPEVEYFMFGHADTGMHCECENCIKAINKYNFSGVVLRFANIMQDEINKFCDEIGRKHISLVLFAYSVSREPPVSLVNGEYKPIDETVIPRKEIKIRMAISWKAGNGNGYAPMTDEKENPVLVNLFEKWKSLVSINGNGFLLWTYETNFYNYLAYDPTYQNYAANTKFFKELNAENVMMQSTWNGNNIWHSLLNNYVAAKILWNPDQDVNAIANEFISLYYKEAAEEVKEFIDEWNENFIRYNTENQKIYYSYPITDGTKHSIDSDVFPLRLLEKLIRILDSGIEKIRSTETLSQEEKQALIGRVESVKATPMLFKLYNWESFYPDTEGRRDFALSFFDILERNGIDTMAESISRYSMPSVSELKEKWL